MKKILVLALAAVVAVLLLAGCDKSPIQKATGLSAEAARAVEDVFRQAGLEYETITEDDGTPALGSHKGYIITTRDGGEYFVYIGDTEPYVGAIIDRANGTALWPVAQEA